MLSSCSDHPSFLFNIFLSVGRKKHGERISVQLTAKAWHRYKNVGKGVASYGRKEKETAKRSQMCVGPDDDDGVVYYKVPTRMTRSQKKHSVMPSKTIILPPINRAKQCIKVLQFIDYFLHTECI